MNPNAARNLLILKRAKQENPVMYRRAVAYAIQKNARSGLNGLGATANYGGLTAEQVVALQNAEFQNMPYSPTASTDWLGVNVQDAVDFLKNAGTVYLGIQQQKTCLEINKARALKNLPPIDCASAGLTPQVNVGVSKEIQLVLFAALGLGLFYILKGR